MKKIPTLKEIFDNKLSFRFQNYNFEVWYYLRRFNEGSLIIPVYQRDDIWTLEQKQNFVRSLFYWIPIPPVILNQRKEIIEWEEFYIYVIDWGQRLRTIYQFYKNELEVDGFTWNTLGEALQKRFERFLFPCLQTSFSNEAEEKMYYRIFNTGWTSHTEEDIKKAN